MRVARLTFWFLAVACLAAALGGCGGGGSSTASTQTSEASTAAPKTSTTPPKGQEEGEGPKKSSPPPPQQDNGTFTARPHHDSGGGSAQFEVKGGDNSIQEFGEEGSESELRKAALALHGFLDSRAEGDFKAACSYLGADVAKSLQQLAAAAKGLKGADCPQLLAALAGGVPASALAEAAHADVGSLRFEGDRAFLIYRGAQQATYAISMVKEGGEWKVGGLAGTPLG
jgi:hypothetical protein